ncbi:MAG: hypothetical protein ACNYPE_13425 [Candidatus Azotimanducaceae bacterium WSBS_2022_MAG_OTU7]
MNKTDEEILLILKETFRNKKKDMIYDPDDLMREWMIKMFLWLSLFMIAVGIVMFIFGKDVPSDYLQLTGVPVGIFFGLLFLHLNNKVENPSAILFVLTWVSMMAGLYL